MPCHDAAVSRIDLSTVSDGFARPGSDTRSWTTIGLVEPETSDAHSTIFSDESGNPIPYGALVMVKLQVGGNVLPCRVAGSCAGNGEGEWHPFVGGDEVIVLVPDGDEKNGGVIIGRLNQQFDAFPVAAGGQSTTGNQVAFKRLLAPYVLESGTAVILRNAATGAALTLDQTGNTYVSDGNGDALVLRSDVVSLQLAESAAAIQLDPSTNSATLTAGSGNTIIKLDGASSPSSQIQSAGTITFTTLGNGGGNHAASAESVINLLNTFLIAASKAATTPASLVAFFLTFSTPAPLAALIAAAAAIPLDPILGAALTAALAIPKTGGAPGAGSPGVMID
jgi:phage baseplate assembly protein gpV